MSLRIPESNRYYDHEDRQSACAHLTGMAPTTMSQALTPGSNLSIAALALLPTVEYEAVISVTNARMDVDTNAAIPVAEAHRLRFIETKPNSTMAAGITSTIDHPTIGISISYIRELSLTAI
jgi:hypothetical protein